MFSAKLKKSHGGNITGHGFGDKTMTVTKLLEEIGPEAESVMTHQPKKGSTGDNVVKLSAGFTSHV